MHEPSAAVDMSGNDTRKSLVEDSFLTVKEGVLPSDLLEESYIFLQTLLDAVTAGKRHVRGKTLLDPKKDSKWERGRTRRVMHFGAHVRGGNAVGAEVEEIPDCLLKVSRMLQAAGYLGYSGYVGSLHSPPNTCAGFGTANASRERCGETAPVVAATVDFFRKRTYTPALAATAPTFALNPHPHYPVDSCIHHNISRVGSKPAAVDAADAAFPERVRRTDRDGSARTPSMENRAFSRSTWAGEGGCCGDDSPDTEPLVCMLWLQPGGGEVIVGSAHDLAQGAKAAVPREERPTEPLTGVEGLFSGMERLTASRGSVMLWDGVRAQGGQVAVPVSDCSDRVFVTFQTLTPKASRKVLRNRADREEARSRAMDVRRVAKEARQAKDKDKGGVIPGTPIVVAEWQCLATCAVMDEKQKQKQKQQQKQVKQGGEIQDEHRQNGGWNGEGGVSMSGSNSNAVSEANEAVTVTEIGTAGMKDASFGEIHNDNDNDDGKTPLLEREHVQAVYDTIAPHWSHTRYKPWPKVAEFLWRLEPCALVADAGCGNGKYLGCDAAGGFLLGSDASVNLLHVCKEQQPQAELLASDCMRLPFRSGVFDAAISIAVLHHFSSEARRLRALSELCRIIKPGGVVLVYAWAIEQDQDSRRSFAAQDVLVPWHLGDHHAQGSSSMTSMTMKSCSGSRGTDASWGEEDRTDDQDTGKSHQDRAMTAIANDSTSGLAIPSANAVAVSPPLDSEGPKIRDGDRASSTSRSYQDTTGNLSPDPSFSRRRIEHLGTAHGTKEVVAPAPRVPRHGVRLEAVPGSEGSVVYQRYCHVYVEGELEGLVNKVDGLRLMQSYYDRSNWCVVAQRETGY